MPVNNWARPNYLLKDSVLGTDSPLERDASIGDAVDSNKKTLNFFVLPSTLLTVLKTVYNFEFSVPSI